MDDSAGPGNAARILPASPTCGSLLPEGGLDGLAHRVLRRPPADPAGRSYRRKSSIVLLQTAAQAEELASADATTTKTLDDIEALLASLKSSSLLVGAPSSPAMPKLPSTVEAPAVAAQRSRSLVKSRFMDVHNNAAAAVASEGGVAGPAAAAAEFGSNSSNVFLQNKPLPPQQPLRQGMARPPPRRNASCPLLLTSAASLISRAPSLKAAGSRGSSGSLQAPRACNNGDDDNDSDDDDGMRLTAETSGTSLSGRAAAARGGSVFLPGSVGITSAVIEPGRSSLPAVITGAQAKMKQPSVYFFTAALAAMRGASAASSPGELTQRTLSMPTRLLPSIGVSKCPAQPSTPRTPRS